MVTTIEWWRQISDETMGRSPSTLLQPSPRQEVKSVKTMGLALLVPILPKKTARTIDLWVGHQRYVRTTLLFTAKCGFPEYMEECRSLYKES
jgi:hypothetical protein